MTTHPTDTEGHGPRHNCAECAERYASERQEAMRAAFAFDRKPAPKPAMTTGVACNCGAHRDSDCDCAHRVYEVATGRYVATTNSLRDANMVAAALNLTGGNFAVATPTY